MQICMLQLFVLEHEFIFFLMKLKLKFEIVLTLACIIKVTTIIDYDILRMFSPPLLPLL